MLCMRDGLQSCGQQREERGGDLSASRGWHGQISAAPAFHYAQHLQGHPTLLFCPLALHVLRNCRVKSPCDSVRLARKGVKNALQSCEDSLDR